ncbi:MAG TPA: response regulator [Chloroflexi bacterium]|nr:response regulator [Chloroflexota bacterium]
MGSDTRILVLEDDPSLIKLYSEALRLEGFRVDQATTIEEARELLSANEYTVFLCDVLIGKQRSTGLLHEVLPALAGKTEVVMLSGKGQYLESAQELGVKYFVAKPTSLDTLVLLIHQLSRGMEEALEIGASDEDLRQTAAIPAQHCPYLGIRGDPETWFAFPTEENYCQRPKTPKPIALAHQSDVCLSASHVNCPVFQHEGEWSGPLPQEIQGESPLMAFLRERWMIIAGAAVGLVIVGVILILVLSGGSSPAPSAVEPTAITISTAFPTPTDTPAPTEEPATEPTASPVESQPISVIPLSGPLAEPTSEISGLAWYGDTLILLPQRPSREDDVLYTLQKEDILRYLSDPNGEPLTPGTITFTAPRIEATISGFEGFEAIGFSGNRVYLTAEASPGRTIAGFLLAGEVIGGGSEIAVDLENRAEILPQADIPNAAEEALVIAGDRIITLYEGNDFRVNVSPVAHVFDTSLIPVGTIPFPNLEWRVTDATDLDPEGRFWVVNTSFFWPGVEQLVEYQYSEDGITGTDNAPIRLLLDEDEPRNWEGVARLDDSGFLIVTDKDPETILAFVAMPRP